MTAVLQFVVTFVLVVAAGWWLLRSGVGAELRAAFSEGRSRSRRHETPQRISTVGVQGAAGLACPTCGGTQFRAERRLSTKLTFGLASMLGSARFVRCVTCGRRYRRG